MLKAESDTDIEATELTPKLNKSGDIAFIHTVVGIGNFRDVCSKKICSARVSVFLAKPNLSLPERMTDD